VKELIAFGGGACNRGKGKLTGLTERSFEVLVGQTDQVRSAQDFVDTVSNTATCARDEQE